jgi:predicted RND superfamily exporter protein
MRQSESVTQVYSIDDVPMISGGLPRRLLPGNPSDPNMLQQAREKASIHPLVAGQWLSPNAKTTVIIVRLKELSSTNELLSVVKDIRRIARTVAEEYGVEVWATGSPALMTDWSDEMRSQRIK